MARKATRGELQPSLETHASWVEIFGLIPKPLQRSLLKDIADDLAGAAESVRIDNAVRFLGEYVDISSLTGEQAIRRIFTPIVNAPVPETLDWMVRAVEAKPTSFKKASGAMEEFGGRIKDAIGRHSAEPMQERLVRLAELLDVDLTHQPSTTNETGGGEDTA